MDITKNIFKLNSIVFFLSYLVPSSGTAKQCNSDEIYCTYQGFCRSIEKYKTHGCGHCSYNRERECPNQKCIGIKTPCRVCGLGVKTCDNNLCVHYNDMKNYCDKSCKKGQKLCGNGRCVAKQAKCYAPCFFGEHQCRDRSCVASSSLCDCGLHQYLCPDGKCARGRFDCSGITDKSGHIDDGSNFGNHLFNILYCLIMIPIGILSCIAKTKRNNRRRSAETRIESELEARIERERLERQELMNTIREQTELAELDREIEQHQRDNYDRINEDRDMTELNTINYELEREMNQHQRDNRNRINEDRDEMQLDTTDAPPSYDSLQHTAQDTIDNSCPPPPSYEEATHSTRV